MRKKLVSGLSCFISWIMYAFTFLVLALIMYVLLVPKYRETFQMPPSQQSSRTLYQKSTNFDQDIKTMFSTLSDNGDMLIMSGCYQGLPTLDGTTRMTPDCLERSVRMYTASFNDVRVRIISELQDMKSKNKNQKFDDPAYVIISQAPYMRDEKGNVIAMQFTTSEYNYEPINFTKVGASANDANRPLYFFIHIILTKHYQNYEKRSGTPFDLKLSMFPYLSKSAQCFISCIGDTTDSFCGCLNRDVVLNDNKSYASKCSSVPNAAWGPKPDIKKNVEADFSVMYALNTKSDDLIRANVFNSS